MENFIRAQFGDAESNCGKKGGITVKYRVDKQKSINNQFYCCENPIQQIIILILFIRIRIISVAVFRHGESFVNLLSKLPCITLEPF